MLLKTIGRATGWIVGAAVLLIGVHAIGARVVMGAGFPMTISDNVGNQWMIYQYGQFQQQGNMPVYSQGAQLQINNAYPQLRNGQPQTDEKTGEIIFENMSAGNVNVTRRILVNKEEGWLRYIDIISNPQNTEQTVNLTWSANMNYGVQSATTVADPKNTSQNIAWVAQTHANGRTAVEMFGGKGAKVVPTINHSQNNSQMSVRYSPTIGGGKQIALMHFHYLTGTTDQGQKFVMGLNEAKVMASLPSAIRRIIVNFRGGENFIGDYEILRGEILDVVELRGGDQLRGTLVEKSYKLETFYGTIELPVDRVIGMINAGEFRPRQLVITRDGEVFGGQLQRAGLALELSSGQVTEIPLSQISRMGYRKRAGEPEEWTFDRPVVLMRSGDRICVRPAETPVSVATRYGQLKLAPNVIAAVDFQFEEHGVHQIYLGDGSQFAGLVLDESFQMTLDGSQQAINFPAASVKRIQFAVRTEVNSERQALLKLANDDILVGGLTGQLQLDTAFNTIAVNAGEVKAMAHSGTAPTGVQIVLWDDTTVSGQLKEQQLAVALDSGLQMNVPVALVREYVQPRPSPSAGVIDSIRKLVLELNADDWKQRDLAQERLLNMGTVVIDVLKEMRAEQSPEAQQRIDMILKRLEKGDDRATRPSREAEAAPQPMMQEQIIDR